MQHQSAGVYFTKKERLFLSSNFFDESIQTRFLAGGGVFLDNLFLGVFDCRYRLFQDGHVVFEEKNNFFSQVGFDPRFFLFIR